jgi:hypothetical protein
MTNTSEDQQHLARHSIDKMREVVPRSGIRVQWLGSQGLTRRTERRTLRAADSFEFP